MRLDEAEARRLRDRGGPGCCPQLAADVGDVTVHRVRADLQLFGDFTIAETVCDAIENLTLALGQQDGLAGAGNLGRRFGRRQSLPTCPDHGVDITVPGEVRLSL